VPLLGLRDPREDVLAGVLIDVEAGEIEVHVVRQLLLLADVLERLGDELRQRSTASTEPPATTLSSTAKGNRNLFMANLATFEIAVTAARRH